MNESRLGRLTPQQQAELRRRLAGRGRGIDPAIKAAHGESALADPDPSGRPLSATQYRMWVGEQAHGASAAYTLPTALLIRGALSPARLQDCLDLLIRRHDALRARIAVDGGTPRQYFDRPARFPLETRHVPPGAEPGGTVDAVVTDLLRTEAERAFSLDHPPYARAVLFRWDAQEHVLMLTFHHAFCDGISLEQLVDELLEAYALTGRPDSLPGLPGAQYADYAAWEHSAEGRARLARNAEYWRSVYQEVPDPPAPPLSSDGQSRGRGPLRADFVLPAGLRPRALELSRQASATVHAVWLAGFAATWHMMSGAHILTVAVPAEGRPEARFEGAVGAFASAMPLALRTRPGDTFVDLVASCTDALFDGADHAVLPVDERQSAEAAVLFSFTGEDTSAKTSGELTVATLPVRVQGTQHPLTITLIERSDGTLYGQFTGQGDFYRPADLSRLAEAYVSCLSQLLEAPRAPLATVSLLNDADRALLARNSSAPPAPDSGLLTYEAFCRWVAEAPHALAVLDADGTELTYQELSERVVAFARALHAEGVGAGIPVAIRLRRCADYLAVTLAVWRLGGWTVPLSVTDPPDRARSLIDASSAGYLVGTAVTGAVGVVMLDVERLLGRGAATGPVPAGRKVQPGDIAYGIFTSGTTGIPKCVVVPHGALANQLAWRRAAIGVTPADRVLQTIPLAFDPAFWQCFGPLTAGAAVIMPEAEAGPAQAALVNASVAHRATVVDVVPSLLSSLDDDDLRRLPARVVFCGGEALPGAQAERYRRLGRGTLYNQYGPSETCIDAASYRVEASPASAETVPIGYPIGGARLYVLDPSLRPVPVGVPGELHVGGLGVAHGYLGRPAETAVRFRPDPFAGPPGSRMYATGDRARWNADGSVQFLGRADDQVKIRGHRVELAEVDRALLAVPHVREAAVVTAGQRFPRLVAFLTGDADLDIRAVRERLAAILPAYMIPAELCIMNSLPLSANGKADRRRLAEIAAGQATQADVVDSAEHSPVLAAVLETFSEILELPRPNPEHDLHELGGTSLGAARIAASLSARLRIQVPVRLVMTHSRAADLAASLTSLNTAPLAPVPAPEPTAETSRPGPQQRWLLAMERYLGHPAPAIPALVRADESDLDPTMVEAAVCQLAERHDALAPLEPGQATLWRPCDTVPLPAGASVEDWPPELTERSLPDNQPGIQAVILRDDAGQPKRLLLLLARNRADGPSAGILARELHGLLAGRRLVQPAESYAAHLRSRSALVAVNRTQLERYWTEALAPVPADPFASRRTGRRGFRHHGVRCHVPVSWERRLADRCAALGVAPSVPFLAALAAIVAEATRHARVAVGVPVGLRSGTEIDRLVGRAVDMVPVVVSAGDDASRVHKALMRALDHADLPMEDIARLADPVDVAVRPAVCTVALITHEYDFEPGDLSDEPDVLPGHWSDLDLELHVEPGSAGQMCLALSGEREMFGLAELRAMLTDLSGWVRGFCEPTTDMEESWR